MRPVPRRGECRAAARSLEGWLERKPDLHVLLKSLASAVEAAGEPARARGLWEKVLALDPLDLEARVALARLREREAGAAGR